MLKKINDSFGFDTRFSIFLKPIENYGGDGIKEISLLKERHDRIETLNKYMKELGWFKNRTFDINEKEKKLSETNDGSTSIPIHACYAARPNSIVIRSNGTLAKCTVALNDERNNVGHINSDGTIFLKKPNMLNFMRGFKTLDIEALHCPMKKMPKKHKSAVIPIKNLTP